MRTLLAFALTFAPLALRAAEPSPARKAHRVERLTEHAYVIFGGGGNIGLFVGEREAVLVDTQVKDLAPGLVDAIASVTSLPAKLIVNTHFHSDHVGGNPLLAPRVQAIVAHANVPARMEADQAKLPAAERGGLPTLLVGEGDPAVPARMGVRLPGLALEVVHRRAAHTDGDLTVELPAERVLHLGDLFFLGMLPFVDVRSGGSFEGLAETIAAIASTVPDDVRIIPGHGPLCGKKELVRYRDFLAALRDHARAHPGWSSQQLADAFAKDAWPEWKPMPKFVTWETLFDAVTGRGTGRVTAT